MKIIFFSSKKLETSQDTLVSVEAMLQDGRPGNRD